MGLNIEQLKIKLCCLSVLCILTENNCFQAFFNILDFWKFSRIFWGRKKNSSSAANCDVSLLGSTVTAILNYGEYSQSDTRYKVSQVSRVTSTRKII